MDVLDKAYFYLFEQWKSIPNYPAYEINVFGHIRHLLKNKVKKIVPYDHQAAYHTYKRVSLYNGNGKKCFLVHRLVAKVFSDNELKNSTNVHHKNGNPKDNNLFNLDIVSKSTYHPKETDLPF